MIRKYCEILADRAIGDHHRPGAEQTLHQVLQNDMRVVRIEDDAERIAELRAERRDDHAIADSRIPVGFCGEFAQHVKI